MKTRTISICILAISAALMCKAQNTTHTATKIPKAYWLNFGAGPSSMGGPSGDLYINGQISKSLVISAGIQPETTQSGFLDFGPDTQYDLNTESIFIGKIIKQGISMMTFSTGISYSDYVTRTNYGLFSTKLPTSSNQYTVGVPLMIQGYLVFGQCVGLGLSVYSNINTVQSTLGLNINLAFGRIQTHAPRN